MESPGGRVPRSPARISAPAAPPPTRTPTSNYYADGSTEVATETALTVKKLEQRRKLTRNSERLVLVLVGLPGRGKSFVARKLQGYLRWRGTRCEVFNVGRYRREAAANLQQQQQQQQQQEEEEEDGGGRDGDKGKGQMGAGGRKDAGACDANFFDPKNEAAARLRQEVAALAMRDMLRWLDREEEEEEEEEEIEPQSSPSSSSSSSFPSSSADFSASSSSDRVAIYDATNSTEERRRWILDAVRSHATGGGGASPGRGAWA